MRVLSRVVRGRFVDVRSWDPTLDEAERRKRAAALMARHIGVHGVLYRPPERLTAFCTAILDGGILERAVQEDHFRFVWDGRRVRALYAFRTGQEIRPEDLTSPEAVLAA
jgi:hypothetical protein